MINNFEVSLKYGIDPLGVPRFTYYHFKLKCTKK